VNPETAIQNNIRLAVTAGTGIRLFRNQVGAVRVDDRYITYGLCPGSSDLIGWTPVKIGDRTLAVFTALEIKTRTGRTSPEQDRFIEAVVRAGGIAGVARSIDDARRIIEQFNQNGL
jgi:hypothetical protein